MTKYFFTFTFAGHLFLLALFGLKLNSSLPIIDLGETRSIDSYFYKQTLPMRAEEKISEKKLKKHFRIKRSQTIIHQQALINEGNGQPITELVAMLHKAIQAQQFYPQHALEMEQTGSTTLSFLLFPTGEIEHLIILKSSGQDTLDNAALTAVNKAVPFHGIDKYLSYAQNYQITLVFDLE